MQEVSPNKKGRQWEIIRFTMFIKSFPELCSTRLVKSSKADIQAWIKQRSKTVKNSTINRELNLISHCLSFAREEWNWMSHNPMQGLRRPSNPMARSRRISDYEINQLLTVFGYQEGKVAKQKREFVAIAFLFAIETAMRAGEICGLSYSDIDFDKQIACLKETKNGYGREVPLSDRAIDLLAQLPQAERESDRPIFELSSGSLSTLFRKYRQRTAIENLTFHDTRHEATTRLASKLHVLALAAVTGHRNIKELMTYYDESAEDIVKTLKASSEKEAASKTDVSLIAKELFKEFSKAAQSNSNIDVVTV